MCLRIIILISLLILHYIINQKCEYFDNNIKTKIGIIFLGESFRLGGQFNRNTSDDKSYKEQIDAINTHCEFMKNLKKIDESINIDIFIQTYSTKFDNNLIETYNNSIADNKNYNIIPAHLKEKYNNINDILYEATNNIDIDYYDYIYIIRIDLILKPLFHSLCMYNKINKLTFPSINHAPYHKYYHNNIEYPLINVIFVIIPKKYNKILKYKLINLLSHDFLHKLINLIYNENDIFTLNDIDLLLKTLHDADSQKDWQPLYKIANRPESTIWTSQNIYYDLEQQKFIDSPIMTTYMI